MSRPVSCECGSCPTCVNREKKRAYAEKYPEKVREIARRNAASRLERLKKDPVAYQEWRERRNEYMRKRHAEKKRKQQLVLEDAQDMGPIEYLPIDKWLEKYGPIGSHGKAAYWSCI